MPAMGCNAAPLGSDPHAVQRVGNAAQGGGEVGMFGLEAFNGKVHAVDQVVVRGGLLKLQLGLDLPGFFMQAGQFLFRKRHIAIQLLAQAIQALLQFAGRHCSYSINDLARHGPQRSGKGSGLTSSVIHLPTLCMTRINGDVSGFLAFVPALGDVREAGIEGFEVVDHRVHAQAKQRQGGFAAGQLLFLAAQRLPLRRALVAGRQPHRPQTGVEPRLQQQWHATDQHAAVQALALQAHQRLPAGVGGRPSAAIGAVPRQPVGQHAAQAFALCGTDFVEPDAGHLLGAQAVKGVKGARGGQRAAVGRLDQAAAQSEQYRGKGGCFLHGNVPK
ncbi:hypothetical protein EMIT047CA2_60184 [Pseudomonas soli]